LSEAPKWINELLSSCLPLEFDVARLLVAKGFRVAADFKFNRTDSAALRDCSVQVLAGASLPFADPEQPTGTLELVLECRHRQSAAAWLFLPDPNPPEKSPLTPGNTIRVLDKFSSFAVDADATVPFDRQLPACYKGLEIDPDRGQVTDSALRQGIAQLQYALPRLLVELVTRNLAAHPGKNVPFLFCPVLLTTAPLLVAHREMGTQQVSQASQLPDLADQAPFLVVYCDYGPEFEAHCRREFRVLEALERSDNTLIVERRRAVHYRSATELPIAVIESLLAADRHWLRRLFTHFIVCTDSQLPTLLDALKEAAAAAIQSRKEV
jgi:hypothetical protein